MLIRIMFADKIFITAFLGCITNLANGANTEEECLTNEHIRGVCTTYSNCPSVVSISAHSQPTICRFERDIAYICCENVESQLGMTHLISKRNNTGINKKENTSSGIGISEEEEKEEDRLYNYNRGWNHRRGYDHGTSRDNYSKGSKSSGLNPGNGQNPDLNIYFTTSRSPWSQMKQPGNAFVSNHHAVYNGVYYHNQETHGNTHFSHPNGRPQFGNGEPRHENQNYNKQTSERPKTTTSKIILPADFRPHPRPDFNIPQNLNFGNTASQNHLNIRKRISESKCEEYSEAVSVTVLGLPLTPDPKPITVNVEQCVYAKQLIVGGENTTLGEFPHMAAIGFQYSNKRGIFWLCGGSLISDQYVLTAAHCTTSSSAKPVKVRLGEYNLMRDDDGAHPEDYTIAEIIRHPYYKPPSKYNDIALLKLSRRVGFRKHIRPACLNTKHDIPESKVIAIGWGRVERDEKTSDVLLKVGLDLIDRNTCNQAYNSNIRKDSLPQGIINSQICAGELSGGKDTCQGDSGGPIEILSKDNRCIHYIVGVTSFGKKCGVANSPGVYTRVSQFINWIEKIVWPQ